MSDYETMLEQLHYMRATMFFMEHLHYELGICPSEYMLDHLGRVDATIYRGGIEPGLNDPAAWPDWLQAIQAVEEELRSVETPIHNHDLLFFIVMRKHLYRNAARGFFGVEDYRNILSWTEFCLPSKQFSDSEEPVMTTHPDAWNWWLAAIEKARQEPGIYDPPASWGN